MIKSFTVFSVFCIVEEVSKLIDNSKLDRVYASPLIRAKRTAQILTDFQKEIITDDRLREMNFGSWDGRLKVINLGRSISFFSK